MNFMVFDIPLLPVPIHRRHINRNAANPNAQVVEFGWFDGTTYIPGMYAGFRVERPDDEAFNIQQAVNITVVVMYPGCAPWTWSIPTTYTADHTPRPITRARLFDRLSDIVQRFLANPPVQQDTVFNHYPSPTTLNFDAIMIEGLHPVSRGKWQLKISLDLDALVRGDLPSQVFPPAYLPLAFTSVAP